MKKLFFVFLISLFLFTGCGQKDTTPDTLPGISENQDTTDTETTPQEPYVLTFTSETIEGEEITSDIFTASKLTMLNVWATYCNPCLKEMPDLGEIATEYDPSQFQMFGIVADVTTDAADNNITAARDLIKETKADTYQHILLNQELYYNLVSASDSVPTTYFFNQQGELLGYLVGSQSKDTWISVIEQLLAGEA